MTEPQLKEQGYKKYEGEGIDVYYALNLCKHAGKCVKGSAEAFDPKRKPWILPNAETPTEMARVIDTCPTKALQYIVKGQM